MYKAGLYHQSNSVQRREAIVGLEKYAPKMKWKKNNNRIIDLGCGDGSVTNILRKYLPTDYTLVGADISERMLKFAIENYHDKQTSYTVLDLAGDLPEAMKGNFNHVFSNFTINWVRNQKLTFQNIFDLLEPGGECFMIFLGYCSMFEVYRTFSQNSKWRTWVHDVDKYISPYHDSEEPDKEIIKLMENTGFVNIEVTCQDKVFQYESLDIIKKLLTAACLFPVPEEKSDDFMGDYLKLLKDIEVRRTGNDTGTSMDPKLCYKLLTVYSHKPSDDKIN